MDIIILLMKNILFNMKITEVDLETLREAAKKAYNPKKHRKDYGVSAFIKETCLRRAKRLNNMEASFTERN